MTQNHAPTTSRPPAASRAVFAVVTAVGIVLLTMVIVVQGRTIETQRELIQTLFVDSSELNKLRHEDRAAKRAQTPPAAASPQGRGKAATPAPNEKMRRRNLTPRSPLLPPHQFDASDVRRNARVI